MIAYTLRAIYGALIIGALVMAIRAAFNSEAWLMVMGLMLALVGVLWMPDVWAWTARWTGARNTGGPESGEGITGED